MEYKTKKEVDKSTVIWLDYFEEKLYKDLKCLLKKEVYKGLEVSYTMSLDDGLYNGHNYVVEGNASISLSKSYEFQSEVITWFNTHLSELRMVLSSCFHVKMTLIYKKKDENNEKYSVDTYIPSKPLYNFSQIILSENVKEEIFNALSIIKFQHLIYNEWGFGAIDPVPKSVLNFYGPPGTGKTMCAHAIADKLGKKLLSLDYAQIESKYVGDAAKNLANAFDTAKKEDCVLFFDEADSFLGRRIQNVTQGADQALNSLRSQMLILLEEFTGVVIFATNLVSNFDQAFESRILKHIKLELPNENARIEIIKKMIPSKLPIVSAISDDELRELSKTTDGFSGRELKNAVLDCLLAKASTEGVEAKFGYEDFLSSFKKKKEEIEMLKQAQTENKRNKILNAFKKGNVEMAQDIDNGVVEDEQKAQQHRAAKMEDGIDVKSNVKPMNEQ